MDSAEREVDRIIDRIAGTALPLGGDDIDTDRIMPARFLRSVRFEGLEDHLFEDDRRDPSHPFSNPAFRGASILLVNRNFGCGSSREHAPQALRRWGIRAVLGESLSEIFFGNASAIGLPCLTAAHADIEFLMQLARHDPRARLELSVSELALAAGGRRIPVALPAAARRAFLEGSWDATALLLDRFGEVQAAADRLPYMRGWRS